MKGHTVQVLKGMTRHGTERWYWVCECGAMSDLTWDHETQAWRAKEKHEKREFEKAGGWEALVR